MTIEPSFTDGSFLTNTTVTGYAFLHQAIFLASDMPDGTHVLNFHILSVHKMHSSADPT